MSFPYSAEDETISCGYCRVAIYIYIYIYEIFFFLKFLALYLSLFTLLQENLLFTLFQLLQSVGLVENVECRSAGVLEWRSGGVWDCKIVGLQNIS